MPGGVVVFHTLTSFHHPLRYMQRATGRHLRICHTLNKCQEMFCQLQVFSLSQSIAIQPRVPKPFGHGQLDT